jgi:hypothetical protein
VLQWLVLHLWGCPHVYAVPDGEAPFTVATPADFTLGVVRDLACIRCGDTIAVIEDA